MTIASTAKILAEKCKSGNCPIKQFYCPHFEIECCQVNEEAWIFALNHYDRLLEEMDDRLEKGEI